MKLVVGIALAKKRAVSSEGAEVPEEGGGLHRLRRPARQAKKRPAL